ncbi:MAG: CDP-glycerol glycerophosphotransferase family protein [Haliea sp.]|nr:CDP-glycerol glycerophosphotransferase family protein [Haliea sp.]
MKEFPDVEGLLLLIDVLICDWSSIAFDYLAP